MVLLVLPQSCFCAKHTVEPESSSITMNSRARVIPAIPSAEGFLVYQDAKERDSESSEGGQGSGEGGRRATCLHIPVSLFFFLPHVFQRYSPPLRINSMTMTAPRMPLRGTALVSLCEPVSLRLLRGDIEQVERSKDLVHKLSGRTWHSLKQVLSCCLMPETLRWTRCGHPRGRLRRYQPKSASQRNCSAAELYTLYTGLSGDLLRQSNV